MLMPRFSILPERTHPVVFAAMLALLAGVPAALAQEQAGEKSSEAPRGVPGQLATNPPQRGSLEDFDPRADAAYGAYQRGHYLTAFSLALTRANTGDPAAQTLIAELYDKGLGVARDRAEAVAWYGLAAQKDYTPAQFSYAIKLLEGEFVERDVKQARNLLEKAAKAGHPVAKFNLAQMLVDERPGYAGFREAFPYYREAANAGVADAYYAMAQMYSEGLGTPQDLGEARKWLVKAAHAGIDTAQVELGIWLANGKGGEKDEKAAFGWISRAARGGNVIAQNRLAKMLVIGIGTEPDNIEGAKWHILARRAGRSDPWLDDFLTSVDEQTRQKALERANRWPFG